MVDVRVLSVSNQSRLRAVFLRAFGLVIDRTNNFPRQFKSLGLA